MADKERLINADDLAKAYQFADRHLNPLYPWTLKDILAILDEALTVEAVPVVYGRWVLDEAFAGANGGDRHVCSVCNDYYTLEANSLFYCPRCGAKMNEIEHPVIYGNKLDLVDGKWKRVYGIVREAYVEHR